MLLGWISLFFWSFTVKQTLADPSPKTQRFFNYYFGGNIFNTYESENITFATSFIVDFGSQYYINNFQYETQYEGDSVRVTLYSRSIHNQEKIACIEKPSVRNTSYFYSCDRISRYLQVITNKSIAMFNMKFQGHVVYSELLAGCYELTDGHIVENAKELVDCIQACTKEAFILAGIKDENCLCKSNFVGMRSLKLESCQNISCNIGMFCGAGNIVPMYFADLDGLVISDRIGIACLESESQCSNCYPGYSGLSCNIRDCETNVGDCGEGSCSSYDDDVSICFCKNGFHAVFLGRCSDINECEDPAICGPSGKCVNTVGSYNCNCEDGFKSNKSKLCDDIDECMINNICKTESSKCVNSVGSYSCKCFVGFAEIDSFTCSDVDECSTIPGLCGKVRTCRNIIGSFTCECQEGYGLAYGTDDCEDIDECQLKTDGCDRNTTKCDNVPGSYECRCNPGFTKNSSSQCTDFDECQESHFCGVDSHCRNLIGSYDCQCFKGYEKTGLFDCIDVDECSTGENTCDKTSFCFNVKGSYDCLCENGTELEVFNYLSICVDIDECKDRKLCRGSKFLCINYPKGFECQCESGFEKVNNSHCIAISNKTGDYRGESEYNVDEENYLIQPVYLFYGSLAFLGIVVTIASTVLPFRHITNLKRKSSHSIEEDL